MQRGLREDQYNWSQKRIGVDVARFGDDRTVIFPRQGMQAYRPTVMRVQDTSQIAARVADGMIRWGAEATYVDDTGHWGHGVIDNLLTAGLPCFPVQFHGPALSKRYANRRAEMWITMADAVRGGLSLPNIAELVAELTVPTYTFVKGQFLLEEKAQVKARLGRSPDLADGLALTYAIPDMPADMVGRFQKRDNARRDFNPYETEENSSRSARRDFDPNEF